MRSITSLKKKLTPGRREFIFAGLGLAVASIWTPSSLKGQTMPTTIPSDKKFKIGVIGAGWLGGTVGRVLVQAGHEVCFSTRHPEELEAMAKELGPRASVGLPAKAAAFGDVLLFAVPYEALPQLGKDLANAMKGKIVLDACNPSSGRGDDLSRRAEADGVAVTTAKLLRGTRVVRAFSAVDATAVEASFKRTDRKLGVPIASDDAEALAVVAQLVRDAGCEPVEVGMLADARSFQRGGAGFRANANAPELRRLLGLKP